jgi:hypothetical protein
LNKFVIELEGTNIIYPWSKDINIGKCKSNFQEHLKDAKKMFVPGEENMVHIIGGEPLIHKSLPWFIDELTKIGYEINLRTNGLNTKRLLKCISFCAEIDLIYVQPENNTFYQTGYSQFKIEKALKFLGSIFKFYEGKLTVIYDSEPPCLTEDEIFYNIFKESYEMLSSEEYRWDI